MPLYGETTKPFELCPASEKGLPGVLIAITEKIKFDSDKVKWLWKFEITEPLREDGEPFVLFQETYRGGPFVRSIVDALNGEPVTDEEWPEFDVEQLVGSECRIVTEHNTKDGKTYCNIKKIDALYGDPFSDQ